MRDARALPSPAQLRKSKLPIDMVKTKQKAKAKTTTKSKKRGADAPPSVNEVVNVYYLYINLSIEQRGSVCSLLKKLDPSCFVATGDVIGEYALHYIDFTNISRENLSNVKTMIDSFNADMEIDEDEDNEDKKLPAKETDTDGNDEEDARKPAAKSNDDT